MSVVLKHKNTRVHICHIYQVTVYIHRVSKKTVQTYFLLELCQISAECEILWHKDSKGNKLLCGVLIFHLA